MSLMFPPREQRVNSIAPVTLKRPFRVYYECAECGLEASRDITLVDEVGDAATVEDFYESGALNRMDPVCAKCACGHVIVSNVHYIRQPSDGPQE